jgi:hypothetical protein
MSCNVVFYFISFSEYGHEGTQRSQRYSATYSLPGHSMKMSGQIRAPGAVAVVMKPRTIV